MSDPLVLERDSIRDQLVVCRAATEANIIEGTTSLSAASSAQAVILMGEMMDLLQYFMKKGGRVLAVPLYQSNCLGTNTAGIRIRIRKRAICELVQFTKTYNPDAGDIAPASFLAEPREAGALIQADVHAIKNKAGITHHLVRLVGAPGEQGDNPLIWKWMFCDLQENETLDAIVREKARWGWAGKFARGEELERGGGEFGDDGATGYENDPDRVFDIV